MLYRFRSKSSADVIALRSSGEALLRALGREPQMRGILEPDALDVAISTLEESIAREDERRKALGRLQANDEDTNGFEDTLPALNAVSGRPEDPVSLRRRAWPLLEMMRRAKDAGHPVTWG
jgi:hypothetical protein